MFLYLWWWEITHSCMWKRSLVLWLKWEHKKKGEFCSLLRDEVGDISLTPLTQPSMSFFLFVYFVWVIWGMISPSWNVFLGKRVLIQIGHVKISQALCIKISPLFFKTFKQCIEDTQNKIMLISSERINKEA